MVQRDGTEALVVYDLDADPLEAEVDVNFAGGASSVAPTPEMWRAFEDPERRTVAVHTHPGDSPLSAGDYEMFGQPGLFEVVAVGSAGSIYRARRGPR
ncbi:MAG: hypothetical protein AAF618_00005, partial [Pseudomonadota bacterium]